jgi:hypothetical protein
MGEARGSCSRVAVVAAAAVCVGAATGAIVYTHHRRQEKLQIQRQLLWGEKPQTRFKRVLADNSDSPFQHFPSPLTGSFHTKTQFSVKIWIFHFFSLDFGKKDCLFERFFYIW